MVLDGKDLLLRVKRLKKWGGLRLRLTKSGRNVTRHAQRMAMAGSICDLWDLAVSIPSSTPTLKKQNNLKEWDEPAAVGKYRTIGTVVKNNKV